MVLVVVSAPGEVGQRPSEIPAPAATTSLPPSGCQAPVHRQLDFWLGEWEVRNALGGDDAPAARSRVTSVSNGCAVLEDYTAPTGYHGVSLSFFDGSRGAWRQLWMDASGQPLEKSGGPRDGGFVLEGRRADGALSRTTWTTDGAAGVRQVIELSQDGGDTWQTTFDGRYRRASAAADPACEAVEGVAALPLDRMILFGELHGTDRSPAAFGAVACQVARERGELVVGLEIGHAEQERVDRFLSGAAEAAAASDAEPVVSPTLRSYRQGVEVVRRALAALGGEEALAAAGGVTLEGAGTFDLATRLQGMHPDRPQPVAAEEHLAVDLAGGRVAYETHARVNPDADEWIRYVYDDEGRMLIVLLLERRAFWVDGEGDHRRRIARAVPHLLLRDALAAHRTLRDLGPVDGRRAVAAMLPGGEPITLFFDPQRHLLTGFEMRPLHPVGHELSRPRPRAGDAVVRRVARRIGPGAGDDLLDPRLGAGHERTARPDPGRRVAVVAGGRGRRREEPMTTAYTALPHWRQLENFVIA